MSDTSDDMSGDGRDGREHRREHRRELAGVPVQDGYDRWAASYDEAHNPTRDVAAAVVRARLNALSATAALSACEVLELGCGTGQITEALIVARRVVALDLSAQMLARARARIARLARSAHGAGPPPDVVFARCDIRAPLPVAAAAFDLAAISLVLEHVADLAPVFAELARALRPGGRAVLAEYHPYRQLRGKQARIAGEADADATPIAAHVHTTAELITSALDAGFALVHLGEWIDGGLPLPPRAGMLPRVLTLDLIRR